MAFFDFLGKYHLYVLQICKTMLECKTNISLPPPEQIPRKPAAAIISRSGKPPDRA